MKISDYEKIPKFIWGGNYVVNHSWKYLEDFLESNPECDLNPDFQRGHVWTEEKQIAYVEFILRGGKSSRDIYFNHPGWLSGFNGQMELVDGKQRMEAVRKFMRNELPAFETLKNDFTGIFPNLACDFVIHVNNLQTRAEVLQWYLDLNSGGVVHTTEELLRVQAMLKQEQKK